LADKFHEKYGLSEIQIDFDLHLSQDDLDAATQIDDGIKLIDIKNCNVEFGFEEDIREKEHVFINFGFAGIRLKKEDFEEAIKRYRLRDMALAEIKRNLEAKK